MTNQSALSRSGASSRATTAPRQDMQSSDAANAPEITSGTSGQEARPSRGSPAMDLSPQNTNGIRLDDPSALVNVVTAFAGKLVALGLATWIPTRRKNGQSGWALFLPDKFWRRDENTKRLMRR
jgi:hypothetical protein